jgi:hypothetical protein
VHSFFIWVALFFNIVSSMYFYLQFVFTKSQKLLSNTLRKLLSPKFTIIKRYTFIRIIPYNLSCLSFSLFTLLGLGFFIFFDIFIILGIYFA